MPQVEACACEKPVIGINAMGMLDTMVHKETAFLAGVAQEIVVREETLGAESGFEANHKVQFQHAAHSRLSCQRSGYRGVSAGPHDRPCPPRKNGPRRPLACSPTLRLQGCGKAVCGNYSQQIWN